MSVEGEPRQAAAGTDRPPWGLAVLVGVALIPLGRLGQPVSGLVGLVLLLGLGVRAGPAAFRAGLVAAIPAALAGIVLLGSRSGGAASLFLFPMGLFAVFSGLLAAAGAMAVRARADRRSDDPEARARAGRAFVILAVAVLLVGGGWALDLIAADRADERAEQMRVEMVAYLRAHPEAITAPPGAEPPELGRIAQVILPRPDGTRVLQEVSAWWRFRCIEVMVPAQGDVTSRIIDHECQP